MPNPPETIHSKKMPDGLEHVQKALRELGKSLKSLPPNPLPKQVHKLRTAARRVEAIAAALPQVEEKESRRLVKSIEPLRKAAGSLRDMDVLAANLRKLSRDSSGDSVAHLIDHVRFVRAGSAQELRHELARKRKKAKHELEQFAHEAAAAWPSNGSAVHAAASRGARNGRRRNGINPAARHLAHELAEWPPLGEQNIHEFRVKLKELRYILQLDPKADAAFVAALGSVQRRIGDWHDWQQLAEIAHEFVGPGQDQPLLARIDETMHKKFVRALASANALRRLHLTSALPHVLGC